jgi:hypothetical protein
MSRRLDQGGCRAWLDGLPDGMHAGWHACRVGYRIYFWQTVIVASLRTTSVTFTDHQYDAFLPINTQIPNFTSADDVS